jgi:hypothetical protein
MGELEETLVLNSELMKVTEQGEQWQGAEWTSIRLLIDKHFASQD